MTAADFPDVRQLAADDQGLRLDDMPDFGANVLAKRVVEDRDGIVCAAVARVEVMAHLYLDHAWSTPRMRFEALKLIHREICRELDEKGIEVMHAQVRSKAFRRRLRDLGWESPHEQPLLLKIGRSGDR